PASGSQAIKIFSVPSSVMLSPLWPVRTSRGAVAQVGMEDTTQTSTRKASFLLDLPPRMCCRFPLARPLLTLPIEVCLGLELCQHFLRILRRFMMPIHLQEVGGGVDVRLGVLVALGDRLPIRATRFEYDCYRGHRFSASVVLWRRRKFVCQ